MLRSDVVEAIEALPLCIPDVATSPDVESGDISPLQPHEVHVAHGLWRIGPGARRFLRRCCLATVVTAGVVSAFAVAILFAELLGLKKSPDTFLVSESATARYIYK